MLASLGQVASKLEPTSDDLCYWQGAQGQRFEEYCLHLQFQLSEDLLIQPLTEPANRPLGQLRTIPQVRCKYVV